MEQAPQRWQQRDRSARTIGKPYSAAYPAQDIFGDQFDNSLSHSAGETATDHREIRHQHNLPLRMKVVAGSTKLVA